MKQYILLFLISFANVSFCQSLESFKKYSFPTELVTAPSGSKIAWALDEQGKRNVYTADGPNYVPKKITNYNLDDGQEITSLQISAEGNRVIYVRGGDHGSNWDDAQPVNPNADLNPFNVKIASVPFNGGDIAYLSEGDEPLISPNSKSIVFIKGGQVWTAPIDSANASKNLFITRGQVSSLSWNPDGSSLLFVSNRGDHSIVGIYTITSKTIRWVSPSFTFDESPRWSTDGTKIVFIRKPGKGGKPDSLLTQKHNTWAIYTFDLVTDKSKLLWKAPKTLRGSEPDTHGGTNLHWAANNKIIFLSYHDGWPHLYSIASDGGNPLLLTPGNFMCEHIKLSADKKFLTFSANTGSDKLDIERRHACMVSVDNADMQVLTSGTGLEWTPVLTDNSKMMAYISATAQRPPMVSVLKIGDINGKIQPLVGGTVVDNFLKDRLVVPQQVIFTSPDGVRVHADLFMPKGGNSKKPAIVYVHGGPPRQMLLGWHYSDYYSNAYASNQYLVSLGYVVLSVNYRLGIGYGHDFHKPAHGGIFGASEYQDIKAAGEWLAKQNYIDASKIGIYGGSYGGYLTAMALAKDSKIFAAGVDIHGVHDWGQNASIMSFYNNKTEKAPDYEKAIKTAWTSSPVAFMDTWKSPVLIIHGDDDRNVRFDQSTDLVNRLEKKGIPYETMVIVDDTHHWMKWENAVKVYGAVADFFERKLK